MLKTERLNRSSSPFARPLAELPIPLRAVIRGLLLALVAINAWPLLLFKLGVPLAAFAEAIFLGLFLWWASGGGPPRSTESARTTAFRRSNLSSRQWVCGLVAALCFAATIHASLVLLFRLVPFRVATFRQGYDLSFIPSRTLQWLAVVVSAISAGICEEILFRGLLAAPHRTTPWRDNCHSNCFPVFHGLACISPRLGPRQQWFPSFLAQACCWAFLPGLPNRLFPA
jgi:membrane protease YdiL (CAAX protease family)